MKQQPNEPYFATSISDYLNDKSAVGIRFPIGHTSAHTIRMYIHNGVLLDENREKRILHTECRLPEKKLYELLLRQVKTFPVFIDKSVQKDMKYRDGISALMIVYPELKDGVLNVESRDIFDYLYMEGQPSYKAMAYMLHYPNLDTNELYSLIVGQVKIPDELAEDTLHPHERDLREKMELPDRLLCNYGAGCFYFYECGKVGYAAMYPDRTVQWYGEPFSDKAQNRINHIASEGNYLYINKPFFHSQAVGRINLLMADTDTGKFRDIYIQQYTDGQKNWDVMLEDGKPLEKGTTENLRMMKGRLSQVQFAQRNDGMYMRCRIDGEMQMYEHVKPEDYQLYKNGKWDAQELAARYFVGNFLAMTEDRSQGMKR